jgi:carboxypeptidase Q
MIYGDAPVKIPVAAITVEDAEMLARLQQRGIKAEVRLNMEAKTLEPAPSGNVVAELRGATSPDEIVVISGHIDCWDVGQGAHDDGAGCVMAMEALSVLRRQRLIPRRTIRVVLWTNEENGFAGAKQYVVDHAQELGNHVAAIEADSGGFAPRGYSVQCADEERERIAADQLRDITTLLAHFDANRVTTGHSGPDVGRLNPTGVVLMGHRCDLLTYFDYHHSRADTLDKVDPKVLSQNVAVLATMAYVLADMPDRLGGAP